MLAALKNWPHSPHPQIRAAGLLKASAAPESFLAAMGCARYFLFGGGDGLPNSNLLLCRS
jgi:hypothetical protein